MSLYAVSVAKAVVVSPEEYFTNLRKAFASLLTKLVIYEPEFDVFEACTCVRVTVPTEATFVSLLAVPRVAVCPFTVAEKSVASFAAAALVVTAPEFEE